MTIIVGIPAFNEEKNIAKILSKVFDLTDKIIVCDDGSSDTTGPISKKMGAIVVTHPKNLGYGASIRSIFEKAKELDGEVLVTFDADGQHRVKDIPKVVEPILKNEADMVIGSRFLNEENPIPKYRKLGIKAITKLANTSTDKKLTDSQSGFRAYNKKIFDKIIPSEYGMGVSTEILIKVNKAKFRIVEVPIAVLYNNDSSTHHPVSHGFSVIFSTMKFISIEHPLQFYGIPGIVFLAIGLFFIVWTLEHFEVNRLIVTNLSLIGIGFTILGTIFLMTSIILYSLVNVVRERYRN